MTRQNVTDGAREIMTKPCPTCGGEGVVKSEETIAIEVERRLRELVAEPGREHVEAFLVRLNPKVTAYFTADGARGLHALEVETGRFFHFEGSEGLPLDHFAITAEGSRAEIEERSVPFRAGEEVHVDIVEPHMYSEDDAVAKIDGYLIEVTDAIPFVGEKKLVRIEDAGRTAARAVLAGADAEAAREATEERRKARERSAKRAATVARTRRRREEEAAVAAPARGARRGDEEEGQAETAAAPVAGRALRRRRAAEDRDEAAAEAEAAAVETLADGDRLEAAAGTGPAAVAEADVDAARPPRRRRSRAAAEEDALVTAENGAEPAGPLGEEEPDDEDAVSSTSRRRGRRGGRRRSRVKAADAPSEASE
jgi:ribonuclease G